MTALTLCAATVCADAQTKSAAMRTVVRMAQVSFENVDELWGRRM
jgi:hypothetical protein